ncbi:MAG: hypothetical protein LBS01_11635 [Prevotellaceae bacterium]|jgi:hypothetical protein|nr:hypothetical protein [Prevotellaceae bacterium]
MNQSKFSLADVLTLLAALAFGFVCFLSANFFFLGNTGQSSILAIIITVLLGGLALGAKLLKKTSRNFKTCFVWEVIFLVLFAIFAFIFAISPFSHYFVVSDQKEDIQNKLTASIMQAENMFAGYERYANNRETVYESKLRSVAAARSINPSEYAECGFVSDVSIEIQIENKMFTLHADLYPTNYGEMKQIATTWLANAKNAVEHWYPISTVNVVKEVERNSKAWLNELLQLSTVRERCEQAIDFSCALSFDDVKNKFTTLGGLTPLSTGLAVLAYVLMLLSWFVTKRHSKFPGLKMLFGMGGAIIDNEL